MFQPPSMLKIISTLYDQLDVAQKLDSNEKLGYKDHRTLTRHQNAYAQMTSRLLDYLAPKNRDEVEIYLSNAMRFLCTLNEPAFESPLSMQEGIKVYCRYVYAPMLATLLHKFQDNEYNKNAIHHIGHLLKTWVANREPAEKALWAKEAIKKQCSFKTPNFTQCVNDIRGSNVQSRDVINKNIVILDTDLELLNEDERNEITSKIAATYHAAMIIRRIEEREGGYFLTEIKNYLLEICKTANTSNLLELHNNICNKLLKNRDDTLHSWREDTLIDKLDRYLFDAINPVYPGFIDYFSTSIAGPPWPDAKSLFEMYIQTDEFESIPNATKVLGNALINYYKMYYYVEQGDLVLANNYCEKVEKASNLVHLGQFNSANLTHKIILHWILQGKMQHNKFDSQITELAMSLPDEIELTLTGNSPAFELFILSLDDSELMMLRLFRLFNKYHQRQKADPIKKLTEIIIIGMRICENNKGDVKDLLPLLNSQIDKNIRRSKFVLPFTKRLSLTKSVNMVLDLYNYINLPVSDTIYKFSNDDKCKNLIIEFDKS
ncbi:hypothetical protein [Serratia fonticola]|uniref:hypothetical protein n=1 Tax=Serratia fonticola TaxID=47917 RepID=UPI00164692C0|nr:hypothetical protein [Serratia fonticola]MBC3231967.1 hypothetical protein [Serratia fonticola]